MIPFLRLMTGGVMAMATPLFHLAKDFAGFDVVARQGIRNPQTRFDWIG